MINIRTFLTVTILTWGLISSAQEDDIRGRVGSKIKSEKIGYLTSALDLSPEEATTFWPVYNRYDEEREQCKRELRKLLKGKASADGQLNQILDLRKKEYEIEKKYLNQFNEILNEERVIDLIRAESTFKRKLLKKVRQKMKRKNMQKE